MHAESPQPRQGIYTPNRMDTPSRAPFTQQPLQKCSGVRRRGHFSPYRDTPLCAQMDAKSPGILPQERRRGRDARIRTASPEPSRTERAQRSIEKPGFHPPHDRGRARCRRANPPDNGDTGEKRTPPARVTGQTRPPGHPPLSTRPPRSAGPTVRRTCPKRPCGAHG